MALEFSTLLLSGSVSVSESVSKIPGSFLHDFACRIWFRLRPSPSCRLSKPEADPDTDPDPDDKRKDRQLSAQGQFFRLGCGHGPL